MAELTLVVFSQLEVVRHSGFFGFHSCALCREVSHQGRNDGGSMPHTLNHWGAPKSRNKVFFFNAMHLLPKCFRFKYGGAKLVSCPGCNLTSVRPFVTQVTPFCHTGDFAKFHSLVLAPELIFFQSLPKIHDPSHR